MTLLYPFWLVLVIPLAAALWLWPLPTRLLTALRVAALALVLLALCGLAVVLPSRDGTVVVIADRSESMPPDAKAAQEEAVKLIQKEMGGGDQLAVVTYGRTVATERAPQDGTFPGFLQEVGRDDSHLAEALERGLSLIPRDTPGRIVVLSDGRWTGRDPFAVASRAAARNVAIDYRLMERARADDLAVQRVEAPAAVAPGESFLITAWVQSPVAQVVEYELHRGERIISSGTRQLGIGLNRLSFRDKALESGNQGYRLEVRRPDSSPPRSGGVRVAERRATMDPRPENNSARVLVGVKGPRPVLHVTRSADSGLAKLLQKGGLKVKVAAPESCRWTLEELSKYSAVLLENVPAELIGNDGMATLAAWVRETGSGLMMTGGKDSYGPGGYYKSPLEPVLPVSMELRSEHRKLALAIAVVLDRSGSMMAPAGAGRIKMDLANLGTAQVLDLLGPGDEFAAVAVDSSPHVIAPLARVGDSKAAVRNKILGIQSGGGGIFVYVGLSAGARELTKAKAGTRHIILFSDAADSEEPGNYKELLRECQKAGITVSVIGLGRKTDPDGALLEDIAKRGKGRIFFTEKADELPRLFAQDTFVVARSTFLDEPTPMRATAYLRTLTGKEFDMARRLGGYNLCYLRPEAKLSAVTLDEYKAPVVASWQAGTGRVLCYTGEADGKYAGEMASWDRVGDYFTSLVRWTAGQSGPLPDNMLVTQEVRNGVQIVQLHLDPERKNEPFSQHPKMSLLRAVPGKGTEVIKTTLRWTGADTLAVEVPLRGGETALATVEVPGVEQPVSLPPVCLPYSPEFKPPSATEGLAALERLGRATGGRERVDLTGVWKDLPKHPRLTRLGKWLLLAAVLLFLLEVFERRTGLLSRPRRLSRAVEAEKTARSPRRRWALWKRRARPAVTLPAREEAIVPVEPIEPAPPPPKEEGMVDALRKARERTRSRTDQ